MGEGQEINWEPWLPVCCLYVLRDPTIESRSDLSPTRDTGKSPRVMPVESLWVTSGICANNHAAVTQMTLQYGRLTVVMIKRY